MSVISNLTVKLAADTVAFDNVMRNATKGLSDLRKSGVDVFNATRTPVERYEAAIRRLGAVYRTGNIDQQGYERALHQLRDEFWQASGNADKLRSHLQALNGQMASGPAGVVGRLGAGWRNATTAASAFIPRLGALTGALSGYAAVAGGRHAFNLAADFEASAISMEVLLRDADRAQSMIRELYDYAAKTPFEFPDVVMAGRQLIGYGETAEQAMADIRMLGNVATALQIPLTELANVFGRNRNQLQLYTRDINELANRGVPVIQYLADHFKVAQAEIRDMVEQGKVGFEDLRAAMEAMSAPGGQFEGMTERLGKSMKGVASTAKDDLNSAMRELGEVIGATVLPKVSTFAKELAIITKQLKHPEEAGIPEALKQQQGFNAQTNPVANASSTAERLRQLEELRKSIAEEHRQASERVANTVNPFSLRFDLMKMKNLEESLNGLMKERAMLQRTLKTQTDEQGAASKYVAEKIREFAPALTAAVKSAEGPFGKMFGTIQDGVDRMKRGFRNAIEDAKASAKEMARARQIIAETRTPQEQFEEAKRELDRLHNKHRIGNETFERAMKNAERIRDSRDEFISEGKRLHEAMKTPAERFESEISRLQELLSHHAISEEDFRRAREQARGEFMDSTKPERQGAQYSENRALLAGTSEAFSAINRAAQTNPDKQRENREKQMLDIERRMEIIQRDGFATFKNLKVWA